MPRVLWALCQSWKEDQIYTYDKSQNCTNKKIRIVLWTVKYTSIYPCIFLVCLSILIKFIFIISEILVQFTTKIWFIIKLLSENCKEGYLQLLVIPYQNMYNGLKSLSNLMYRVINITFKIYMCVDMSDIYWYIIKHWYTLTANIIVCRYMPETVLCVSDVAVNKTENVPASMVFLFQSGNETAI